MSWQYLQLERNRLSIIFWLTVLTQIANQSGD